MVWQVDFAHCFWAFFKHLLKRVSNRESFTNFKWLQIVTKSYYKEWQVSQSETEPDKYYKMWQVLQSMTIITKQGATDFLKIFFF